MNRLLTIALSFNVLIYAMGSVAIAQSAPQSYDEYGMGPIATPQSAPPSYEADPNVYRVIFEDHNFRVIKATWQPGVQDKAHSHPLASVAYYLTDCDIRVYTSDGKSRDFHPKAGFTHAEPIVSSHFAKNIGSTECVALFVERK